MITLSEYYATVKTLHGQQGEVRADAVEYKEPEGSEDHHTVSPDSHLQLLDKPKRYTDPNLVLNPNGSIKALYIHQSLLKAMMFKGTKRDFCPYYIYGCYVTGKHRTKETKSMFKGNYFEAQCFNNGFDKHGKFLSYPLLKNGKRETDQLRIDEQIFNFKENVAPKLGLIYGPGVIWKQFVVTVQDTNTIKDFGFDIFVEMETDLITPLSYKDFQEDFCIVDLKLTIDRNGCHGEYCWGEPERMDHIQAAVYSFSMNLPFYYLIFDYKKNDRGWKLVPVHTNVDHPHPPYAEKAKYRKHEMFETIRSAAAEIEYHHLNGWSTNPIPENCMMCPIVTCKDRNTIKSV